MPGKPVNHSITPTHQGTTDSTISSAPFSMFSRQGLVVEIVVQNRNLIKNGSVNSKNTITVAISLRFIGLNKQSFFFLQMLIAQIEYSSLGLCEAAEDGFCEALRNRKAHVRRNAPLNVPLEMYNNMHIFSNILQ